MTSALDRRRERTRRVRRRARRVAPFALAAGVVHLVLAWTADDWLPRWPVSEPPSPPVSLVILEPEAEPEPEPEEDEPVDPEGQIVDVAPPEEEKRPEEADYLAEHDATVEEETRTEIEVNPEVLAHQRNEDKKMEQEDLLDLDVEKPSTGAKTGNEKFDPDRDGAMAALPSPWTLSNKKGLQDPVPSSHAAADLSGAPNNDLLNEKHGDELALNTKEFLYAAYLNRIRRLVNFYWEQNLDNLPRSVRLARPRYTTGVNAVLDASGSLERLDVVTESGSAELDDCVTRAFHAAGPFPNPPEGLVGDDGKVRLPPMNFTVVLGVAENRYQGVDPRAGVQFPGLLKSPR